MTKGRCKHCSRQGLKIICAKGLDPGAMAKASCRPGEDYRLGLSLRIPCDTREWYIALLNRCGKISEAQMNCINQKAHCDQFEEPTDAEVAAYEAEGEALVERFRLIAPLIDKFKLEHKGKSWQGIVECPVCKGKLHLSHAALNGHVCGQCETEGCLGWIE